MQAGCEIKVKDMHSSNGKLFDMCSNVSHIRHSCITHNKPSLPPAHPFPQKCVTNVSISCGYYSSPNAYATLWE